MFISTTLLIRIFFLLFTMNIKHACANYIACESAEEANKKKSRIRKVYHTSQYSLRSISDCARRWPHPRRRPKQQKDIVGDSDRKQRYLLEGLKIKATISPLPPTSYYRYFAEKKGHKRRTLGL
jgi:hypothetical protein